MKKAEQKACCYWPATSAGNGRRPSAVKDIFFTADTRRLTQTKDALESERRFTLQASRFTAQLQQHHQTGITGSTGSHLAGHVGRLLSASVGG